MSYRSYVFRRPLTEKDCARGYHVFDTKEETLLTLREKCKICGREALYMIPVNTTTKRVWADNHRLDLLAPHGATEKEYHEFYVLNPEANDQKIQV